MATKRRFVYKGATAEEVRARANMRGGDFDRPTKPECKTFKPREGKNKIRILPPTWESPGNYYGYEVFVVYGVGPDKQTYLSLKEMSKGRDRDPLDEAYRAAIKDGDEELAKQLKPKKRIAMWVIDRYAEEEGPKLWLAPYTVAKDFADLSIDQEDGSLINLDNPDEGFDIRFERGASFRDMYPAAKMRIDREPSPLSEDQKTQDEWLEYITDHPIPDCFNYYSYEHISQVFNGEAPASNDDDEPKRTRVTNGVKHDEDGVVEDDNDPKAVSRPGKTDDESASVASSLRAKLAAKRAAQEVDDDDEDDEPRRRRA